MSKRSLQPRFFQVTVFYWVAKPSASIQAFWLVSSSLRKLRHSFQVIFEWGLRFLHFVWCVSVIAVSRPRREEIYTSGERLQKTVIIKSTDTAKINLPPGQIINQRNLVPRALFPGVGGGAGKGPAREKRPGNEVEICVASVAYSLRHRHGP